MLHHLFYFGVLLPTVIIVIFFIVFLICWFPLNLRQRFQKPKFKGGAHNSTHTSLASASSSYPKEYWDQVKLSRSETRQTTLSACTSKYVPGDFPGPGSNDEDWRYMSRKSIDEGLRRPQDIGRDTRDGVWVRDWLRGESSTDHADSWPQDRRSSPHARTNYALLDDEPPESGTVRTPDYYCESHQDLSPLSDDTIDERPPRPDDDRHTSQLHFICGGHRNGYCPLVQNWDTDVYPLPRTDSQSPMELGAKYLVNADCSLPAQTFQSTDLDTFTQNRVQSTNLDNVDIFIPRTSNAAPDTRDRFSSFKSTEPVTTTHFPEHNFASSFKYSDSRKTQNGYTRMTNKGTTVVPLDGYTNDAHTENDAEAFSCSPYAVAEIRNPVISV